MAVSGPVDLPQNLRFVPPSFRSHSRSPSRSPNRKTNFSAHELDPLLSNLSPASTLNALQTTEAISPTKYEHDILSKSIKDASPDERALGIRAALAAQKVREWCAELSEWNWPDQKPAGAGKGFEPPGAQDKSERYLGSLTVKTVCTYEDRVEEIKDALESLDVDELKQHVLNAHVSSRSRPSSSNGPTEAQASTLNYIQLRDFTAVITATIVQTLPFLARLMTLLTSWDIRLIVLRQIPTLLKYLRDTRNLLDGSLKSVESDHLSAEFTRDQFLQDRETLAESITDLGTKFDRLLDTLEGRNDALPERWIDEMDSIEADFASWVVEAERRVFYNEWIERNGTNKPPPPELLSPAYTPVSRASPSKLSRASSAELQEEPGVVDASNVDQAPPKTEEPEKHLTDKPKINVNVLRVHESVRRLRESAPHAYTGTDSPVSASEPHNNFDNGPHLGSQINIEARPTKDSNTQAGVNEIEGLDGFQETSQMIRASQELPSASGPGFFDTSERETLKIVEDMSQLKCQSNGDSSIGITSQISLGLQSNDRERDETTDKPKRPTPLLLPHQFHKRGYSNISAADSVLSDTYTDLSSAEIMDASTAEVVGTPVFDPMPRRASVDLLSTRKPTSDSIQTLIRPRSVHSNDLESPSSESFSDRRKKALSLSLITLLPKSLQDETVRSNSVSTMDEQATEEKAANQLNSDQGEIRRASLTPIETVFPNQIRDIMVDRRGSKSSINDTPFSPSSVYSREAEIFRPTSKDGTWSNESSLETTNMSPPRRSASIFSASNPAPPDQKADFPFQTERDTGLPPKNFSPPAIPRRSSRRKSQAPQAALSQNLFSIDAPSYNQTSSPTNIPLRIDVSNLPSGVEAHPNGETSTQHERVLTSFYSPSIYSPNETIPTAQFKVSPPTTAINKIAPRPKTAGDKIDERISNILTSIPVKIKLVAEPTSPNENKLLPRSDGQAETSRRASSNPLPLSKSPSASTSTSNSTRSSTPTPCLTLSPARRTKNSHPTDSDVKLYHLYRNTPNQAKDAPPMKLFVRLVGQDGERVMVRVGGGWADLGEYLREYAHHHGGSRRISGNQFEVQNIPTPSPPIGVNTLSRPSNNISIPKRRPSVPLRPESALDLFNLSRFEASPSRSSSALGASTHTHSHRSRRSTTNAMLDSCSNTPSPSISSTATPPPPSHSHSRKLSNASFSSATPSSAQTNTDPMDFDFGLPQNPPIIKPNYTPLGASGPKSGLKSRVSNGAAGAGGNNSNIAVSSASRHSVTPSSTTSFLDTDSEKWVDDMVGQARRGSSGNMKGLLLRKASRASDVQSKPAVRDNAVEGVGVGAGAGSATVGGAAEGQAGGGGLTPQGLRPRPRPRPKSRMGSLESIGGIKRVFLRRKEK